jgi:serine/threonine protein kinase
MSLAAGAKLGPYEIVTPIGAGGMPKSTGPAIRACVAIKISSARFSERFEREARAIASLNHPNICALHDVVVGWRVLRTSAVRHSYRFWSVKWI